MPLRLAIAGALGRTGGELLSVACDEADVSVVAALTSPGSPPRTSAPSGGPVPGATLDVPCDVLVDLSRPEGTRAWVRLCAQRSIPVVIGTTGLGPPEHTAIEAAAEHIAIVLAPNLSIGVQLLRKLSRDLVDEVRRLELESELEIVEMHHRAKRDAPSGTARLLAEDLAGGDALGRTAPIHSLRLGDRAGDHSVHLALAHETLSLSHSAHSRRPYALGALRAARWVVGRAPGLYDMQRVLFDLPARPHSDGAGAHRDQRDACQRDV